MKTIHFTRTVLLFFLALPLISCSNRRFSVDDLSEKQTFVIKKTLGLRLPSIDSHVKIRVKGNIDGKAIIYIPNGTWIKDPFYTIKLDKGNFDKVLSRGFTYNQFSIIYEPITAKEGNVEIFVDAP